MKVSIVMPAYNEEKRIGKTLEDYSNYFEVLRKQNKLDYEILVVINNTTDKTEEIVRIYQKLNKRIRYLNLIKGGKGYAVIEGFKDALNRKNNELIGFVDADGATPPEAYYDLITHIGNYDGAIASRYLKESRVNPKQSFQRIFASRIYNLFVRALFFLPYKDTQCGAKIFRSRALSRLINQIEMSKWSFDLEILYLMKVNKMKVCEMPIDWMNKKYSKIKIFNAGLNMFADLVKLRMKYWKL